MEILRFSRFNNEAEKVESASFSELIKCISKSPNRAINLGIKTILLDDFAAELKKIKHAGIGEEFRRERIGIYYVDNNNLTPSTKNYFSHSIGVSSIKVEFDPPLVNPNNPKKYLPKTKSVGLLLQYGSRESLPNPDNLLHLLLEDMHFKAATAAFFMTPNENMFAIFRTIKTPQLNKDQANEFIAGMRSVKEKLINEFGLKENIVNASVLRDSFESMSLRIFHGKLKDKKLNITMPQNHIYK